MIARALAACALLACATCAPAREAERKPVPATTEMGTLEGAAYRIDIPTEWNRSVVVVYQG